MTTAVVVRRVRCRERDLVPWRVCVYGGGCAERKEKDGDNVLTRSRDTRGRGPPARRGGLGCRV